MNVKKLIALINEDETISARLCGEDNEVKYVISHKANTSPEKRYRLYAVKDDKITFTGQTASSPLTLEEAIGF